MQAPLSIRFLLLSALTFLSAQCSVHAEDWPQWLGAQRDSVWREKGILDKFPADGVKVNWRVDIGGGYAGPAVAGGRLFVTDYVAEGDKSNNPNSRNKLKGHERVWCLSAKDGSVIWKHEYACNYELSYPAGPRATPTVDGDLVYTLGAEGHLFCLSVTDGSVVWAKQLRDEYKIQTPLWGFCGHPLVDGNRLICLVGGEGSVAVAFNKKTGKEIWRSLSAAEPGYCPPTMIQVGGRPQLIVWDTEAINGLNPETGQPIWSYPHEVNYKMSIATPRQAGELLFAGGIVNKAIMLKLSEQKPFVTKAWSATSKIGLGPSFNATFVDGDVMYGVDRMGELRCVKVDTGERLWSTYAATTGSRGANSASAFLVKHEDRFFIFNDLGDLVIAQLTPEGYREISRAHVIEPTGEGFGRKVVWVHPAFANRSMFVRNDREIVSIDLSK